MKKWIETNAYTVPLPWKIRDLSAATGISDKGGLLDGPHSGMMFDYIVDDAQLNPSLRDLINFAEGGQWEIKGVLPLTTSKSQIETGGTWGYGMGFSQITGMVVLLQRTIEVTDAEAVKISLRRRIDALRQSLERSAEVADVTDRSAIEVEQKGNMISRYYALLSHEFPSKKQAEARAVELRALWDERFAVKTELDAKEAELERLEAETDPEAAR